MMPLIPATSDRDRNLFTGRLSFNGFTPCLDGDLSDYSRTVSSLGKDSEDRTPVIIMDVKGLRRRNMDDVLLKKLKVRGHKVWFLTQIETLDDVLDAFNTDADSVVFPLHTVYSYDELEDMIDVSDSLIPAIFIRNGNTRCYGRKMSCRDAIYRLRDCGFRRILLFDTDGSMTADDWKESCDQDIIPFSADMSPDDLLDLGFEEMISPSP